MNKPKLRRANKAGKQVLPTNYRQRQPNRTKRKKPPVRLHDYEPALRGLAQNRWGGHRNTLQRGYGKSYGAASPGRSLEGEELAAAKKKYEERR